MTDEALPLPQRVAGEATSGDRSQANGRQAAFHASAPRGMVARVAWRNLWRRRLRTWLSAGGIAFAVFLVSAFMALQSGTYGGWIETATGLMTGHAQLQHPDYFDEPDVGLFLNGGTALARSVEALPGVVGAAPRAEAFALVSVGERSYGALVMGVDAKREAAMFSLPARVVEGEYLPRSDSAFIGASLATNLGVSLGDEVVALGSAQEGGVAALVLVVDGIFDTGVPDLDRSLMQVRLPALQGAFQLGDAVHRVAIETDDPGRIAEFAPAIADAAPSDAALLDWQALMPELEQAITLDRISALMIYWLLMALVALSLVGAFMMTVFERTREFGMLLAIGMRPNAIVGMLAVEAVCIWVLGAVLGSVLCTAVIVPLSAVGIDVAALGGEQMQGLTEKMMMPTRMYPALDVAAFAQAPLVMLAGTLLAMLIPGLRVRRLKPVEALREEE